MSLRALLQAECEGLAEDFTFGVENVHRVGESLFWRGTIDGTSHAGSTKLRPETRLRDEEKLLTSARDTLREISSRRAPDPTPEE